MEPTTMEQLAAYNAEEKNTVSNIFGLNFQKEYTKELNGYDYYFGDGYNADGDVAVRFMGVPMAGHNLTKGWAGQFLDFAEHFYRNPVTKKIVSSDAPTYAWEKHWAKNYIRIVLGNGWITADEDGEIAVDQDLTRGEYAVILWKAIGCPDSQGMAAFTDVTDAEQIKATAALNEKKIVVGIDGTNYNPSATLTREDGITMLVRAFGLKAQNPAAAEKFTDWAAVSDYAQDAVAAAVEKEIVIGVGNNLLCPKSNITLAEMAKLTMVSADSPDTKVQ